MTEEQAEMVQSIQTGLMDLHDYVDALAHAENEGQAKRRQTEVERVINRLEDITEALLEEARAEFGEEVF